QTRKGSTADARRLETIFTQLCFTVKIHVNLTANEIRELLTEISEEENLKSHEAFVLFVLTHGDDFNLFGSDGIAIHSEDILELFCNPACPYLVHKPKMFFFNTYRIKTKKTQPRQSGIISKDRPGYENIEKCGTWGDMLVVSLSSST